VFPLQNGYSNASRYYVIRTLPIFISIDPHLFEIRHTFILSKFQWNGKERCLSDRCHNVGCKPGYVIRLTS